jgi:aspartate racemase
VLPVRARQEDVMHLIYQNVKAGIPAEIDKFRDVEKDLRSRGAEVVILGCTELAMIGREQPLGPGFLDTTQILAREAILRCGKQIKPGMLPLIS